MNNLSWFIYLTQVVDNLQGAACIALGIGVIGGVMVAAFSPIILCEYEDFPFRRVVKIYAAVMGLCVLVATFTPSRQTMILIAGSEIGERVVKSDDVQSVVNPGMDLIRKWIKQESEKIKDKS